MIEPDIEVALSFLKFLFAAAMTDGYINVFTVEHQSGQRRTAWAPVDGIEKLRQPIWDFAYRGDVWFGCALRREVLPNGQRGGLKDCLGIPALWLDVDVNGPGHRTSGLAQSYEEARLLINRYPEKPDAVVRSGHGFQVWWKATEMLDQTEAITYLGRWRRTWLGYAKAAHIHLDDVWDLPRIMRLPGTYNWKEIEPVKVTARWKER